MFAIDKKIIADMIRTHMWVESTSRPQGRDDIIQLLVLDKSNKQKITDEPFPGLTAAICEWIDSDEQLDSCVDICVVDSRKFITLKFTGSTGASEVSE